ncbi:glycosyltransferase family 2 protein [Nibricoccus aquaticus]|uniref:glycosyltransferase family 2 protein n=1 Tax=Nibricoccus aquaticus TaxID=2576891 RepID=UPI0015861317|nr:glycosyltransferase [Nibricoccus aquaticus]
MRVSFLIPLYNCLPLTQAMLDSLQATLPVGLDHEIILIDDGSADGTRDWLRTLSSDATLPNLRVLINDRNLGYAATNNRAASIATGDLLVLLNNDLVLTSRWLEPMLAAHAALGPRAGIVGNVQLSIRTGEIDHTGIVINAKAKPVHDRELPPFAPALKPVPAVTGACLLIARELWLRLGGFDTAFINGGEDVDLCLRAARLGLTTAVAQRSIIHHHVSSSPGRKLRDEQNSHLLASRWRPEFARLSHRAVCRDYLARELTAATVATSPLDVLQAGLHAAGLTSRPPVVALRRMADALDNEFSRWDKILPARG